MQVRRDSTEEVVGFFIGQVAKTEDLADFAGGEEFFELWRGKVARFFFLAVVPAGVRLMWKGGEERGGYFCWNVLR